MPPRHHKQDTAALKKRRHPMTVIDLSHPLTADMPVYPGTPPPEIRSLATFEQDGFRERQLTLSTHIGTHVDAPAHMLPHGRTLDQFPPDRFIGAGLCIHVALAPSGIIEWGFLQRFEEDLSLCDFVLLRTGWGPFWGSRHYYHGYPVLTADAAERLTGFELKGVGTDTLSVDAAETTDFPVHLTLLEKEILIIENLARLDRLPAGRFGRLCCLPLPLADADGAPARVVAIPETRAKDVTP